jgi:hypothetical protein
MSSCSAGSASSSSTAFARLYEDASEREARLARTRADLEKRERDALDESRRRALALGTSHVEQAHGAGVACVLLDPYGNSEYDGKAVGERLFEIGKAMQSRRQEQAVLEHERRARAETWVCSTCGCSNPGTVGSCEAPSKNGLVEAAAPGVFYAVPGAAPPIRYCGRPRPQDFVPAISSFARRLSEKGRVPFLHRAHLDLQLALFKKQRSQREVLAQALAEAEVAQCSFKPAINSRSEKLAVQQRIKMYYGDAVPAGVAGAVAAGSDAASVATGPTADSGSGVRGVSISAYDTLYEDARRKQSKPPGASQGLDAHGLAQWHGCSFKPDIGSNAARALPETNTDDFFERLFREGAAARVKVAEARRRLALLQEEEAKMGKRVVRRVHVGPSLYEARERYQRMAEVRVKQEQRRVSAEANQKYVSASSGRLLDRMRKRAVAGIYIMLVRSSELGEEQKQSQTEAAVVPATPGSHASAGGVSVLHFHLQDRSERVAKLSPAQIAHLIAAVDAHGDSEPEAVATPVPAKERAVAPAEGDAKPDMAGIARRAVQDAEAAVETASALLLDVDTCCPGMLDPLLGALVERALDRIREALCEEAGGAEAPKVVTFEEFAGVFGRVLEEAGGGSHIYLLTRRQIAAAALEAVAQVNTNASGDAVSSSEPDADKKAKDEENPATFPFAPALNKRSVMIVERLRQQQQQLLAEEREASLDPNTFKWQGAPEPVHERLARAGEEYEANRHRQQVQDERVFIKEHPFKPTTLDPTYPPEYPVPDVPTREELKARQNAEIAARVKHIIQHSAVLNPSVANAAQLPMLQGPADCDVLPAHLLLGSGNDSAHLVAGPVGAHRMALDDAKAVAAVAAASIATPMLQGTLRVEDLGAQRAGTDSSPTTVMSLGSYSEDNAADAENARPSLYAPSGHVTTAPAPARQRFVVPVALQSSASANSAPFASPARIVPKSAADYGYGSTLGRSVNMSGVLVSVSEPGMRTAMKAARDVACGVCQSAETPDSPLTELISAAGLTAFVENALERSTGLVCTNDASDAPRPHAGKRRSSVISLC